MTQSGLADIRWRRIKNSSGETIPAYGICQVSGVTVERKRSVTTVIKPNASGKGPYLVNGPLPIPVGQHGEATDEATYCLYDNEEGTPAAGERWGAKAGQFALAKECSTGGFVIQGDAKEQTVFAKQWNDAPPIPVRLSDCRNIKPDVYVSNPFEHDKVYKVDGRCWYVNCLTPSELMNLGNFPVLTALIWSGPYEDCESCLACWQLTEVGNPSNVLITNTDLAADEGGVVLLDDDKCYYVAMSSTCENAEPVVRVEGYPDDTCGKCWHLICCAEPTDTLDITNNLLKLFDVETPEEVFGKRVSTLGKCYRVDDWDMCGSGKIQAIITAHGESCEDSDCACWLLTPCNPSEAEPIIAHGASIGSKSVDLVDYADKTLRLSTGDCFTLSPAESCEGSVEISILEAYEGECTCKVYTLINCEDDSEIASYVDYPGMGFPVGKIFEADDDSGCWEIIDDLASFADSVSLLPKPGTEPRDSCDICLKNVKYKLELACQEEAECPEQTGDDAVDPIVTKTPELANAIGKKIRYKGMPFSVSITSDAVTHESIEFQGPFDSCEDLLAAGVSATFSVVDEDEDRILKLTFENGILVSVCPGAKGSEECPPP